jgi:hypothetical protein
MARAGRSGSSERPARSARIVRLRKVGAPDPQLAAEIFGPLIAARLKPPHEEDGRAVPALEQGPERRLP